MKYTYILWDFNGTLFDDAVASLNATNILLERQGLPTLPDVDALRRHFGFPVKDYYAGLGFDFETQSYETLAVEWAALYEDECRHCGASPDTLDTVTKLNKLGFKQTIISACEHKMLTSRLRELGLDGIFEDVCGMGDVNAHSKVGTALAWREQHPEASALMIGDTPHDSEVAAAIGADCIMYSGGFVSRERLERLGNPVIDELCRVIDFV